MRDAVCFARSIGETLTTGIIEGKQNKARLSLWVFFMANIAYYDIYEFGYKPKVFCPQLFDYPCRVKSICPLQLMWFKLINTLSIL